MFKYCSRRDLNPRILIGNLALVSTQVFHWKVLDETSFKKFPRKALQLALNALSYKR